MRARLVTSIGPALVVLAVGACTSPMSRSVDHPTTAPSSSSTSSSLPKQIQTLSCPRYVFQPQSSDLADNVVAKGTDCQTAEHVVASASDRPDPFRPYSSDGFRCVPGQEVQPPGGGLAHVPFTCEGSEGAEVNFDRY